jgi:CrcB protein
MIAYIALGGVLGTLARYFLQGWVQQRSGLVTFPVGTLAINLVGSFIVGLVIRLATGSTLVTPDLRAALTIGFCGAFTTMSTFSYESMKPSRTGSTGMQACTWAGRCWDAWRR